jgi:cytochrome c biogenesis protein CcmG, thiol:disulfide interchange protein DsbE
MRRLACIFACTIALAGCGSDDPESAAPKEKGASDAALAGSPKPLAALHDQANQLLGGGAKAFKERLGALKGYPVVVNKWASWCGPCRAEFPYFQRQALQRGKRIAFVGVNSNDNDANAREFLAKFPVSYPSYKDPDLGVAAGFDAVQAFPATAFYDAKGKLAFVHQGGYPNERKLAEDVRRYAR